MFTAIRKWFQALTTATVVKLSANVMELEKQVELEFNFGVKMAGRYAEVSRELNQTRVDLFEARKSIEAKDEQLALADSAYRSLLRDWDNQRAQLHVLRTEVENLKQQLFDSIDLTNRYSELADIYLASYEKVEQELDFALSRQQLYRDCCIENQR